MPTICCRRWGGRGVCVRLCERARVIRDTDTFLDVRCNDKGRQGADTLHARRLCACAGACAVTRMAVWCTPYACGESAFCGVGANMRTPGRELRTALLHPPMLVHCLCVPAGGCARPSDVVGSRRLCRAGGAAGAVPDRGLDVAQAADQPRHQVAGAWAGGWVYGRARTAAGAHGGLWWR